MKYLTLSNGNDDDD